MLKDVTKTIVRCADETYIKHMSYWLPGWQEICEWPTETRYARFDQFFDFIATICRWFVPAQAEKGRYEVKRYCLYISLITTFLIQEYAGLCHID